MQTRWLSLGLLVAIIGPACKRQEARDDRAPAPSPPSPAVTPTPPSVDTAASGWDSPETIRLAGLHYTAPTRVFGALGVALREGYFDSIGAGYKIGTFVDGRYRGADLVSAQWRTDEPCKGEGCDDPMYLRFVRVKDELVFLPRNSDGGLYVEEVKQKLQLWTGAFSPAGLTLVADSQFAVRATRVRPAGENAPVRSEEHTSELQSLTNLVCRLLLEKKQKKNNQ